MSEHPKAKKTAQRVLEVASELRLTGPARPSDAGRELALMDAEACENAASMIATLDTEVFRLRAAIGSHFYGRMSSRDLLKISQTWNNHE